MPLERICNPLALNISICNALIGLQVLILLAAGLQIWLNEGISHNDRKLFALCKHHISHLYVPFHIVCHIDTNYYV